MKVYVVLMDGHNDMTYEDHWYTTNSFVGVYASVEKAVEAVMEKTTKERIYEDDLEEIEEEYRDEYFEDVPYDRKEMGLAEHKTSDGVKYHAVRVYYRDYGNITADYYIKPCEI